MDVSRRRLREKVGQEIPYLFFSSSSVSMNWRRQWHSTNAWWGKSDESNQRDYDLPISSQTAIYDEYEREDDDDKDEKIELGDIMVEQAI